MMFDSGASCGDVADSGWARRPLMGVITSRDHASPRPSSGADHTVAGDAATNACCS